MISRLLLFYAARDLPRARELLEAALDVEFSAKRHLEQTTSLTAKMPGGVSLELWQAGGGPVSRVQLEFTVPNPDAAAERLTRVGFEVRRLAGTVLVIDPAGNTVALTGKGPKETR